MLCATALIVVLSASAVTAANKPAAREVIVGPAVWFTSTPKPAQLPGATVNRPPDFPVDLYSSTEIGYTAVTCTINSAGNSFTVAGTHPGFERETYRTLGAWEVNPSRLPDALGACIWVPVIFNPASATPTGPTASPRLMAVVPIITPRRASDRPNVLRMKLSIDASGNVTAVIPEEKVNPANLPSIREAVQQWRFSPARENGKNVPAEIVVPVLCQAQSRLGSGVATVVAQPTTARPIKRVPAEYPFELRRASVAGHAIVTIDIDTVGNVQDAVVVESDDPAFSSAALAAITRWKFEPARTNGQPVKDHQRIPFTFSLDHTGK